MPSDHDEDRNGTTGRAHCPQPKCARRPLHPIPDDPQRRLQCLRCCRRYQPDDPTLDWGPGQPMGRPPVGGPPITLLLGDERLARVDARAARRGRTRSEVIRRAIDRHLAPEPDTRKFRTQLVAALQAAIATGTIPGVKDPAVSQAITDVVIAVLNGGTGPG